MLKERNSHLRRELIACEGTLPRKSIPSSSNKFSYFCFLFRCEIARFYESEKTKLQIEDGGVVDRRFHSFLINIWLSMRSDSFPFQSNRGLI